MPTLSSTLTVLRQGLQDYLGDTYRFTTSGAGNSGGTTVVDATNGVNHAINTFNEWWLLVTSGTDSGNVRRVDTFVGSTGTWTVKSAFTAQIAGSVTFEVMRYHPTAELRWALNQALQDVFPYLKRRLINEDLVTGNALRNGDFEEITGTSAVSWAQVSGTVATYAALSRRGSRSLAVTNGAASQDNTTSGHWPNLADLGGQTVWFEAWAYCGTASTARIGVLDPTSPQYSDYQSDGAMWELLRKQVTISDTPTNVRFRLYSDTDNAAYFDSARVLSRFVTTYALPLDFQSAMPSEVLVQTYGLPAGNEKACDDIGETVPYSTWPWVKYEYDNDLGLWLLRFTRVPPTGYRIRLVGGEYIGEVTATTDTVPLNAPETKLLYPLAASHLYNRLASASTGSLAVDYRAHADRHLAEYERRKAPHRTLNLARSPYKRAW